MPADIGMRQCHDGALAFVGWDEIPAFVGMAVLGFHPSLRRLA
jgi:hypothetical protein